MIDLHNRKQTIYTTEQIILLNWQMMMRSFRQLSEVSPLSSPRLENIPEDVPEDIPQPRATTSYARSSLGAEKSQPQPRLTFGVELEFSLAYQPPNYTKSDPDPHDPRPIRGLVTTPDPPELEVSYEIETQQQDETHEHIAKTLQEAGLACAPFATAFESQPSPEQWLIEADDTVKGQQETDYKFTSVEVVSPAFYFCQESKSLVSCLAQVLTSRYRLNCNFTSGLRKYSLRSSPLIFDMLTLLSQTYISDMAKTDFRLVYFAT